MSKSKNKKIQIPYPKTLGFAWMVIATWVVVSTQFFRSFDDSNWIVGYGLLFLLFLPGAFSAAYGILLGERELDLRPVRVIALAVLVAIAAMVVCGWFYFAVNFPKT